MRRDTGALLTDVLVFLARLDGPLARADLKIASFVAAKSPIVYGQRERAALAFWMRDTYRRAKYNKKLLTTSALFDNLYTLLYRLEIRSIGRAAAEGISHDMTYNRKLAVPRIIYVCTSHQNPRKEHRDMQGKLYVDRYWRKTLRESGYIQDIPRLSELLSSVMTVQEAIRGPHWLCTSPNCHHALVPVATEELLKLGSPEAVVAAHPELKTGFHRDHPDDASRARARQALRRKTVARVSGILDKPATT